MWLREQPARLKSCWELRCCFCFAECGKRKQHCRRPHTKTSILSAVISLRANKLDKKILVAGHRLCCCCYCTVRILVRIKAFSCVVDNLMLSLLQKTEYWAFLVSFKGFNIKLNIREKRKLSNVFIHKSKSCPLATEIPRLASLGIGRSILDKISEIKAR